MLGGGLNVGFYWIGNWIVDFFGYLLVAIFAVVMCQVLRVDSLINGYAMTATCLLFLFYGLANIPLTYILGYLFKKNGSPEGVVYFFNLASGSIVTVVIVVMR